LIIVALYLNHMNLLAWKNIIILIVALAVIEIFFMSIKTKHSAKI